MAEIKKGSFTLPGEAGFESLTLKMAEKWGADVIRDSDGTKLSEDITKAGYGIYSTICVIRADNAWAKKNMYTAVIPRRNGAAAARSAFMRCAAAPSPASMT